MNTFPKPKRLPKPPVRVMPDGREVCDLDLAGGRIEYDDRKLKMVFRQGYVCPLCRRQIVWSEFDHEAGRGSGGGHRDDRIEVDGHWQNAAVCRTCNTLKGSKRYHWINGKYQPVPAKERGTQ